MNIIKKDLIRINKGFGGNLRSDSSIDYALDVQKNNKLGDYKKLAYLLSQLVNLTFVKIVGRISRP